MIIQSHEGSASREAVNAVNGCEKLGIPWRFSKEPGDRNECHVGSVEFCQQAIGKVFRPRYYPGWLSDHWFRVIWLSYGTTSTYDQFCKPAWAYKVFPPKVIGAGEFIPVDWWASTAVEFTQEWRYYIANGEVLTTGWYDGKDDDEPAPKLKIKWPADFCGAVDFGRLSTGEIALVESHHPFACGWYGESSECELWAMWLQLGWEYLNR